MKQIIGLSRQVGRHHAMGMFIERALDEGKRVCVIENGLMTIKKRKGHLTLIELVKDYGSRSCEIHMDSTA